MQRAVSQRELGAAPGGDVARDDDQRVVDGAQRGLDPDDVAVGAPRAERDAAGALAQRLARGVGDQLGVLLHDDREDPVAHEVLGRAAEQRPRGRRRVAARPVERVDGEQVGGVLDHRVKHRRCARRLVERDCRKCANSRTRRPASA